MVSCVNTPIRQLLRVRISNAIFRVRMTTLHCKVICPKVHLLEKAIIYAYTAHINESITDTVIHLGVGQNLSKTF